MSTYRYIHFLPNNLQDKYVRLHEDVFHDCEICIWDETYFNDILYISCRTSSYDASEYKS